MSTTSNPGKLGDSQQQNVPEVTVTGPDAQPPPPAPPAGQDSQSNSPEAQPAANS